LDLSDAFFTNFVADWFWIDAQQSINDKSTPRFTANRICKKPAAQIRVGICAAGLFISFGFLSQSSHPQFAEPTAAPSSSGPAHACTDHTETAGTYDRPQPVRGNNKASYPAQFCPPKHSVRKHADDFYKTAPKSQPFFSPTIKKTRKNRC